MISYFYIGLIIVLILLILFVIYNTFSTIKGSDIYRYTMFSDELESDMDRYGIEEDDQKEIQKIVEKVVEKKENEKTLHKYIKSTKNGFIRGCLMGLVTSGGDMERAVYNGITFAVLNPVIMKIS